MHKYAVNYTVCTLTTLICILTTLTCILTTSTCILTTLTHILTTLTQTLDALYLNCFLFFSVAPERNPNTVWHIVDKFSLSEVHALAHILFGCVHNVGSPIIGGINIAEIMKLSWNSSGILQWVVELITLMRTIY